MKNMIANALVLVLILSLTACVSDNGTDNGITVPKSSSDLEGKDYKDVMTLLQVAGFTKIEVETLEDLIIGWLTKDGEVEKVSINGDTDFSASSKFPNDSKIVITYHTYSSKQTKQESETTSNLETKESTGTTEATEAMESLVANKVYSISDCEDLQALIKLNKEKDESSIISTVSGYKGKTVELQLITAYVEKYKDYKTRFNYLLYAVNGEDIMLSGPAFMFEDVSYHDLHLTGSNIPDTFGITVILQCDGKS